MSVAVYCRSMTNRRDEYCVVIRLLIVIHDSGIIPLLRGLLLHASHFTHLHLLASFFRRGFPLEFSPFDKAQVGAVVIFFFISISIFICVVVNISAGVITIVIIIVISIVIAIVILIVASVVSRILSASASFVLRHGRLMCDCDCKCGVASNSKYPICFESYAVYKVVCMYEYIRWDQDKEQRLCSDFGVLHILDTTFF
jgi:hypothetical protein